MSANNRGKYPFEGRMMSASQVKAEYGIVYGEVAIREALVAGHKTVDSMVRFMLKKQQRAAGRCLQGSRNSAKKHSRAFVAANP